MLGTGQRFDTNSNNFFQNKPVTPLAPVDGTEKVKGAGKPAEGAKPPKPENPYAKVSLFDAAKRDGGYFVMQEEAPQQRYDGHSNGDRFHAQFC